MSEQLPNEPQASFEAPAISRKEKKRISWIWLVPLIAALMGLSLVVRTWLAAGTDITITFPSADGLEVGKTQLRYKDVNVGVVKSIGFNKDRSKVVVEAELSKALADLAREGTNFWIVRPRLDVSGVSGLGTLLSGAYIGMDAPDNQSDANMKRDSQFKFEGLEAPPLITQDRAGKRFTLKAKDLGSIDVGSPVYYRHINVGRVIGYKLDKAGDTVNVEVFVDAPNDEFVTGGTRFWNVSGVDFSVAADGVKLRTQSLVSMLAGGIAFEPVYIGRNANKAASAEAVFDLYASESLAKANTDEDALPIRMRFDQSIRGLNTGASVDFGGITLGYVTKVSLSFDSETNRFYSMVEANLYPERLGSLFHEMHASVGKSLDSKTVDLADDRILGFMIQHGLRAQLKTANLLTGQLYVSLNMFARLKPVPLDNSTPIVIPTIPGNLDQLQQQLSNIVNKIEKIPFDKIGEDVRTALASTTKLMERLDTQVAPQAQTLLKEARASVARMNDLLSTDGALRVNAEQTMQEINRASRSLRALADFLQANPEALLRGRGPDAIPGVAP